MTQHAISLMIPAAVSTATRTRAARQLGVPSLVRPADVFWFNDLVNGVIHNWIWPDRGNEIGDGPQQVYGVGFYTKGHVVSTLFVNTVIRDTNLVFEDGEHIELSEDEFFEAFVGSLQTGGNDAVPHPTSFRDRAKRFGLAYAICTCTRGSNCRASTHY